MATFKPIENPLITHEDFQLFFGPFRHICIPSFANPNKLSKYVAPATFEENLDAISKLECFEDDVWVIGHVKTGTNWVQEMVWLINNDLNYTVAREQKNNDRYVYIEGSQFLTYYPPEDGTIVKVRNQSRPRHIKSHLTAELLPSQVWTMNSKIVYVSRNPKDVVVSWFHFCRHYLGFKGSKELFFDAFLRDQVPFGGFFDSVLGYWAVKDRPNVLFLQYEEMKLDMQQVLRKTATFFGKNYSDEQFRELEDHLSIEKMRKNPAVNFEDRVERNTKLMNAKRDESFQFIRKGVIGSHLEDMSSEYIEKFDEWINASLVTSDFNFQG